MTPGIPEADLSVPDSGSRSIGSDSGSHRIGFRKQICHTGARPAESDTFSLPKASSSALIIDGGRYIFLRKLSSLTERGF